MVKLRFRTAGWFLVLVIFVVTMRMVVSKGYKRPQADRIQTAQAQEETPGVKPQTEKGTSIEEKHNTFKLAEQYKLNGDLDKAISILKAAIEEGAVDPSILALLGDCYIDKGEFKLAEQALEDALFLDGSESPYANRTYARLHLEMKNYDEALSYLEKALNVSTTDQDKAQCYAFYAIIYRSQGKPEEANQSAREAIKLMPENEFFKTLLQE
jgi:tetratricopeptide (TPR) repeat protein